MKIIVSTHCDTVFRDPYCQFKQGILKGACDNFASILTVGRTMDDAIWNEPNVELVLTEDEEMYMDGAKCIATRNNPKDTLIIVQDVTKKTGKKINFTIENVHEVKFSEIKKALKDFTKKYRIIQNGTESEAWLYAEKGFSVIELDVPVSGGLHSLDSISLADDQTVSAKALLALLYYFKDKEISAIRSED